MWLFVTVNIYASRSVSISTIPHRRIKIGRLLRGFLLALLPCHLFIAPLATDRAHRLTRNRQTNTIGRVAKKRSDFATNQNDDNPPHFTCSAIDIMLTAPGRKITPVCFLGVVNSRTRVIGCYSDYLFHPISNSLTRRPWRWIGSSTDVAERGFRSLFTSLRG